MRIVSCHVEGFGVLQKKDVKMEALTRIYGENGTGKSTLAAFIKAMFFGLPSVRVKEGIAVFNERAKYCPFVGGKFGGSIEFTHGGKEYRIERYFDKKSATKDTLKVFENGEETKAYADPGQAFFGMDESSFLRTLFITADDVDIATNEELNAKIAGYVEGEEEGKTFPQASAALEEAKKRLKAARGNNDLITRGKEDLRKLMTEIEEAERKGKELSSLYQKRKEKEEALCRAEEVERKQAVEEVWKEKEKIYFSLIDQVKKNKKERAEIRLKYPRGIPKKEEINELSYLYQREEIEREKEETSPFTVEKRERYEHLNDRFHGNIPTQEEESSVRQDIKRVEEVAVEIRTITEESSYGDKEEMERLKGRFTPEPTENEVEYAKALAQDCKRAEAAMQSRASSFLPVTNGGDDGTERKKREPFFRIAAVTAFFVLLGGVALLFIEKSSGFVLLTIGLAGLGATGYFYLRNRKKYSFHEQPVTLDEETMRLRNEYEEKREKLSSFLSAYGYGGENALGELMLFLSDLKRYTDHLATRESVRMRVSVKEREAKKLSEKLEAFFDYYEEEGEGDFSQRADSLFTKSKEYARLKAEYEANEKEREQTEENAKIRLRKKQEILTKYALTEMNREELKRLLDDRYEAERLEREIAVGEEEARKYAAELPEEVLKRAAWKRKEIESEGALDLLKKMSGFAAEGIDGAFGKVGESKGVLPQAYGERTPQAEDNDGAFASEKKEEPAALRREIAKIEEDIEKIEEITEKLPYKKAQAEQKKKEVEAFEKKYELLCIAQETLIGAERSLREKYVAPMKNTFLRYAEALEEALGEKVVMDKNFRLLFEREGELRSDKHLSSGQRALCALCFRLALVDNIFTEEAPFIVMDDPFLALDEEHMEKCAALLERVAKDKQILYFCCHDSRKI